MIQMSPWPSWGPTLPPPQKSQLYVVSRATKAPEKGPGPGGGARHPLFSGRGYASTLALLPLPVSPPPALRFLPLCLPGREPVPMVHGRGCAIQDCTHPKRQVGAV